MFEFIHDIAETWLLQATEKGLGPLRQAALLSHLKGCQRCRSFALDLVEFSHGLEPRKASEKLPASEQAELHASLMAAFHRERIEERSIAPFERAAGPAIRPSFVKAIALACAIVALATLLGLPELRRSPGSEAAQANVKKPIEAVAALEPSPTLTPAIKIENK